MRNTHDPDDPVDVRQACWAHRKMMYDVCRGILHNHHDAEDAVQIAVVTAITSPHSENVENWPAYLYRVAENAAKQYVRKEAGERRKRPEPRRADRAREDEIEYLFARATAMLDTGEQADFELYQQVTMDGHSQKEVAGKHDLSLKEVRRRRKKAARTIRTTLIAAYLAEHPGGTTTYCAEPMAYAAGEKDLPALRVKITDHMRTCGICRDKRKNPEKLLRRLLAVAGLGLTTGLLARLLAPKKVALAATTTLAVVTVAVLVEDEPPAPPDVVLVPQPANRPAPSRIAPPTVPSPTRQEPRPAPRQQTPEPEPAPESGSAPSARPSAGDDRAEDRMPVIEGGGVEERRLVLDGYERCDDGPETTGVGALVRNADEVIVHLRDGGRDIPVHLTGLRGSWWGGTLGPFGADTPAGRYAVIVEAVGTGGETTKKIAELYVTQCGGRES